MKKVKILVMEDDPFNQEVIRDMLTILGDELGVEINIDIANDGKEGIDLYDSNNYDIVLTDMDMPNIKGLDALKYIKSKNPEKPVIVITAFGLQGDRERFLAEGFDGYLPKPVDYEELKEVIRKYI
ncbi:MAG: response regulator [Hydrogenothermaceae bacterium]